MAWVIIVNLSKVGEDYVYGLGFPPASVDSRVAVYDTEDSAIVLSDLEENAIVLTDEVA